MIEAGKSIQCSFEAFPSLPQVKRIKVADEMTVYETSIWIWTFGYLRGWRDAHAYGKSFRDNEIAGNMLPELSLSMLEHLGIQNPNHRVAVKQEIDVLFPKRKKNQCRVSTGMRPREVRHGSAISMNEMTATTSSTNITASEDDMGESVFSTSAGSSVEGQLESMVTRSRCLVLTLSSEQSLQVGERDHLKSIFAKFNYNIEVRPGEKPNSYILIFDDEQMALKAHAQSDEIGYKLVKYRDKRPRR